MQTGLNNLGDVSTYGVRLLVSFRKACSTVYVKAGMLL